MMPYFTKLHLLLDAKKQLDAELREYIAKRVELLGRRRAIRLLTGSEEPDGVILMLWTLEFYREKAVDLTAEKMR
jgi:hypothetical protein